MLQSVKQTCRECCSQSVVRSGKQWLRGRSTLGTLQLARPGAGASIDGLHEHPCLCAATCWTVAQSPASFVGQAAQNVQSLALAGSANLQRVRHADALANEV